MTDMTPEFYSTFGLVFSRPLSPEEQMFTQQVIGYASASHLRIPSGEGPSFTWAGDQGVIVSLDTTKTYSDDISFLFGDFWEKLGEYLKNGSKPYERASRGKPAGFQLIPSIGFDAEIVETIVDTDWEEGSPSPIYVAADEIEFDVMASVAYLRGEEEPSPTQVEDTQTITLNVPKGARVTITLDF
jgi:hypothetical protein